MYCQKCNKFYNDDIVFCSNCGAPCVPNPQPQEMGFNQPQSVGFNQPQDMPQQNMMHAYSYTQPMPTTKKKNNKALTIVLIILCSVFFVSTVVTAIIAFTNAKKSNYYETYYDDYNSIIDEYDFLHEYAFVANSDDSYYHHYNCDKFDENDRFYILNKNYAESNGLRPCPDCIE